MHGLQRKHLTTAAMQGVPKFMIFRNMELVEEFSTRDKRQLIEAVRKHTGPKVDLGEAPQVPSE